MANNDTQIRTLLTAIETKKTALGAKPRASWKSNGLLKIDGASAVNINIINKMDVCVEIVANLLKKKSNLLEAQTFLELPNNLLTNDPDLDNYLRDLKLKGKMILWDVESKKLKVLQSKLKDLRSEDAKTEDALADIVADLG